MAVNKFSRCGVCDEVYSDLDAETFAQYVENDEDWRARHAQHSNSKTRKDGSHEN